MWPWSIRGPVEMDHYYVVGTTGNHAASCSAEFWHTTRSCASVLPPSSPAPVPAASGCSPSDPWAHNPSLLPARPSFAPAASRWSRKVAWSALPLPHWTASDLASWSFAETRSTPAPVVSPSSFLALHFHALSDCSERLHSQSPPRLQGAETLGTHVRGEVLSASSWRKERPRVRARDCMGFSRREAARRGAVSC